MDFYKTRQVGGLKPRVVMLQSKSDREVRVEREWVARIYRGARYWSGMA